jgi:hypothetical protein
VGGGVMAELRSQVAEIECLTSTHASKTASLGALKEGDAAQQPKLASRRLDPSTH